MFQTAAPLAVFQGQLRPLTAWGQIVDPGRDRRCRRLPTDGLVRVDRRSPPIDVASDPSWCSQPKAGIRQTEEQTSPSTRRSTFSWRTSLRDLTADSI
jgi:hypothetical protein